VRILQISEAFTGGVFASVTGLCNGLAVRGHEVHLAFARRGETPADVRAHVHPAVQLHELALVRSIDPRSDWRGLRAIVRLMRELAPDVVHLHSSKAGVLGRLAARWTGRAERTFYSPRGLAFLQEDHSRGSRLMFEKIEWAMARLGGTVVACSASEMELVATRVRPHRIALVENAVDVCAIPARVERGDGRLRIGTAGRITYARNPPLFARLARSLAAAGADFVWIGGGEPEDTRALEEAGVRVTGWLPRTGALSALSELDVYVHPSRWEGMPIALIEAQICGLPAVARDVVGNRDVVRHGETGFLGRDHDEMAAQLARLIAEPDLRRTLGERAREVALDRFDLARVVDECLRLYAAA
jgi:glycosyltransferase involved in cell wall biosynthesis